MKKGPEAAPPKKSRMHIRVPSCPTYQVQEELDRMSPEDRAYVLQPLSEIGLTGPEPITPSPFRVPSCPTYQINQWLDSLSPEERALTLGSLFDDGQIKPDLPPSEA